MATLNTLRTRGGVIVSIVIALALMAFILGDLFSSGGSMLNDRKTRVGEINGTNVGYIEYSELTENLSNISRLMTGRESLSAEEHDRMRDMAWETLIMKNSYKPGFSALGLAVDGAEQEDMTTGVYLSPVITGTFVNPNVGVFDPALLRQFVSSIPNDPSGNSAALWSYLKNQMVEQRLMSKYINLVSKGMFVTDLEVEQSVEQMNTNYSIDFVARNFSSVADSLVTVTNADLKKYYDKHRERFFQRGSVRQIEYVLFDLLPSPEDYQAAQKHIDGIAAEFAASDAPMQYATQNSQSQISNRFVKESDMEPAVAAAIWGKPDAMYGPVLRGETYTLARLGEARSIPDSLGASHILLPPGSQKQADSLVTVIKKGGDFAALAQEYSLDQNANMQGGDLGRFTPETMIPEFSDACLKANRGDVFTVETQYGIHVVRLTYKSAPVQKAQLAQITYTVEPSDATEQQIYQKAQAFYAATAGTLKGFQTAASTEALIPRRAMIRNVDRNLNGLDESRTVVNWAFNSKVGAVSGVTEIGREYYLVAALMDARDDGYLKFDQVANDIKPMVLEEKKADYLLSKTQGTTLAEVAASAGQQIQSASNINYGSFNIDGVGVELRLIGAVTAGLQPGTLSKPVKGYGGLYFFNVTDVEKSDYATAEAEKVRLESMTTAYLNERLNQAMQEQSDVIDRRVKF